MMAALSPDILIGKAGVFGLAARHRSLTRSWGAWDGDVCIACGGLAPAGDGVLEAWFACQPRAARRLVPLARAMRLTLETIAETERVAIRARVAAGHEPGRRLAKLAGFHPLGAAAGVETWEKPCPT